MHAAGTGGDFVHGWRWRELLGVLALGVAILLLWRVPYAEFAVYPFRLFATFVHELAHGGVAIATGGAFEHFFVNADLSGTAWTRGGIRWLVTSAGYVGCALAGNALILIAARGVSARAVLIGLGALLAVACLMFVRNAFGIATGLTLALALIIAGRRLPAAWRDGLLLVLAMQLVLDGFNSLLDLITLAGDPAIHTDARTMAQLTGVPATLWALGWSLLSLVFFVLTLRIAYRRRVSTP